MSIPYTDLLMMVKDWITEHPYQSVLHTVNSVVFVTPAAATVPVFYMLGFTVLGPDGGTAASNVMAWLGSVAPGGLYATMGGYGASVAAGAAQASTVASSVLGYIWGKQI